jgi:pimeloyl-ACP methyl ester carboxylesterase
MESFHHSAAGIDWYCERRGQGPTIVLIPSGEGDCGSFESVAQLLAADFAVLTFDMPGFSRSSPPPEFGKVTVRELTDQVAELLRSLGAAPSTVYGCSSGGQITLELAARHEQLVRNALVHEVPLVPNLQLAALNQLDDAAISTACADIFRNVMNEDAQSWDLLGVDYHARLSRNYVTWVRHYVHENFLQTFTAVDLRRRPLVWTVGGLSPTAAWFDNIVTACRAEVRIEVLMCRHFPQVSVPRELAAHIRKHAQR